MRIIWTGPLAQGIFCTPALYNAAQNVTHSGDEVQCVAIFGPKGAGNCVNQPEQIMPPALTHTPHPEEMDTLCWGPSK